VAQARSTALTSADRASSGALHRQARLRSATLGAVGVGMVLLIGFWPDLTLALPRACGLIRPMP
jgi:hypothetical protein